MKNVARAGLGFIAGLFMLWGTTALSNKNYLGVFAVVIALFLFYYAWKG